MRKYIFCVVSAFVLSIACSHAQLIISEFVASSSRLGTGLLDEDGDRPDWIEIRNRSNTNVNLLGWALTDNANDLNKWTFPNTNLAAGGYMVVFASGKDRKVPGARLHTSFNLAANGEYLALVRPDESIATEFATQYPPQVQNVSYGFGDFTTNATVISTTSVARVRIPANGNDGTNWTILVYDDSSWTLGTNGVGFGSAFSGFVHTDIRAAMSNVNASAQMRFLFNVANPTNTTLLTLRMRFNDGIAVFINGVPVVSVNTPEPVNFNSSATFAREGTDVEEYRIGGGFLSAGTNVLAIQGLNVASNDPDFLVEVTEAVLTIGPDETAPFYFTVPTPGAANPSGVANPGPAISDFEHTPNVPKDNEDIIVTANVFPTFSAVAQVVLRYKVMFSNEVEIPMFDDGAHGDGRANDGNYGATIPASSAAAPGQMVRWYFRAVDSQSRTSRWPIFSANTQTEFLGTIVEPTNLVSKLPIVHLFAPASVLQSGPAAAAGAGDVQAANGAGARGLSLFHDGEFYDNIEVSVRGNTTATYLKKSHRFEFNPDHPFRHTGPGPRIRETSFIADYPDPAYMRQGLSYWLGDLIGAPSPFYIPHRLQLNGQFYQLANHNDVGGEELLARLGYNPSGALFNAMGQVTPARASTGGPEKKTRQWDRTGGDEWYDYTALANAIAETVPNDRRKTNAFEMFDVPEVINYMVVGRWAHENDDVWANMSLYHDNDGDNLWRIIPFDMNLSWGAIFFEGGTTALVGEGLPGNVIGTNDVHKGHPFYGSANILSGSGGPGGAFNRVYDTFFKVPELRAMYLRRMRTMLDKYIGPPGTPTNASPAERRILELRDLMLEEANRDRAFWGWPARGGQSSFLPGITFSNAVNDMLQYFVRQRRNHFYGKHSITNTALPLFDGIISPASGTVAGIPLAQPTNAVVLIGDIEINPSSANQGHEFIQITNPNSYTIDISDWQLAGGIRHKFHPGTVIPSNSVLYLTPDIRAFRTRTATPRAGQGLFVQGNYEGQLSARGETLTIIDDTGRLVTSNSFVGNPSLPQQHLRITEIMYHSAPATGGGMTQDDFDYLELKNIGPVTVPLIGVHFTNGIDFAFTAASAVTNLAPGERIVLVKNPTAFTSRYGSTATVAGTYTGSLDNNGERLRLDDAVNEKILDFDYESDWYPVTDGLGLSLVVVNENAHFDLWDSKTNWRPSADGGSPGGNDEPAVTNAAILVTEVLTHTDAPAVDRIELFNPTTSAVNIGGWYLSDDFSIPRKFRIPAGTMIAAGGYVTFSEANFNTPSNAPTSFSFGSDGDEAYLFSADAAGNLTAYFHGFDFGPGENGVSFGRYINSQTNEHFVAQAAQTFGAANSLPRNGPVVISEIMYHPPDVEGLDNSLDEYVELHNVSTNAVRLYDSAFPTNGWKLADAVDFAFKTNHVIPAGGYMLVVNFNPTNTLLLDTFRAIYNIPTNIAIVGPYGGKLDNSDESIELYKPDSPNADGTPYILVERVHYRSTSPWDPLADGFGPVLQRRDVRSYGNDPTNWVAATSTPGAPFVPSPGPVITQQPQNVTVAEASTANLSITATGSGLGYQWRFNGAPLRGATGPTLSLTNIQLNQSGSYAVLVFNSGGTALSSNATVTVRALPIITQQPQNVRTNPGLNATFSVAATATGTPRYQWRFNGVNIPGATGSSLSVSNVQLDTHAGFYSVQVTDDVGPILSTPASLIVLVRAVITNQPQPLVAVQGQDAVFSVLAGPDHPLLPLNLRWLRDGATYIPNAPATVVYTNLQKNPTIVRVAVTNLAGQTASVNLTIPVLTDTDGDGVPDDWETANGFNSTNAADGLLDIDGDGMRNRDEFQAGTDPRDSNSVLRASIFGTNGVTLQFTAQPSNLYIVQYRTNLGAGPWQTLSNVSTQGLVRPVQVFDSSGATGQRFYRVGTQLVP